MEQKNAPFRKKQWGDPIRGRDSGEKVYSGINERRLGYSDFRGQAPKKSSRGGKLFHRGVRERAEKIRKAIGNPNPGGGRGFKGVHLGGSCLRKESAYSASSSPKKKLREGHTSKKEKQIQRKKSSNSPARPKGAEGL